MSQICLVVFVGLPGAGKTTLCNALINHMQKTTPFQLKLFNYDQLCSQLITKNERKSIYNQIQSLIHNHAPAQELIIFIDDNNYYKSMRKEFLNLAKFNQIGYLEIYLKISLELALIRNDTRDTKIPHNIIQNMCDKFEEPVATNPYIVIIDSHIDVCYLDLEQLIKHALKNPRKIDINCAPDLSKLQIVDLLLRKIVHEKIVADKTLRIKLNNIKRDVYFKIKNDLILIDDSVDLNEFLIRFFD